MLIQSYYKAKQILTCVIVHEMVPNLTPCRQSQGAFLSRYRSVDATEFLVGPANRIRRLSRLPGRSQARLLVDRAESNLLMTKWELVAFLVISLVDLTAGCCMAVIGHKNTSKFVCNVKLGSALRTGGVAAIVQVACMLLGEWMRQLPERCSHRSWVRKTCYSIRCCLVLAAMAVVLPLFGAVSTSIATVVEFRPHDSKEYMDANKSCDTTFVYLLILFAVPFLVSCLIVVASCN